MSSNRSRPRFQIPAHVFAFTLASIPGVAYAMYWKRNHQSDEEFEKTLQQNYAHKIQGSKDKREDMVQFFSALKNPNSNPDQEEKFKMLLQGGRGEIKRQHAVDDKLYGKEEGIRIKKELTTGTSTENDNEGGGGENENTGKGGEKMRRKILKKKKHKMKRIGNGNEGNNDGEGSSSQQQQGSVPLHNIPSIQQVAVGTVVVGTLAVITSSLIGGAKRGG